MVFVDELAYYLFLVSFAVFILAYFLIKVYLSYRKGKMDVRPDLEALSIPLLFVGGFMLVSAFAFQLLWPLPGSFNILYFDPMAAFGLVLVAFSLCLRYKTKTQYVGFLALLAGLMVIWYGWSACYNIGLPSTSNGLNIEVLMLFLFYGGAAVLMYPATVILDNWPKAKGAMPVSWLILLALLCAFLVASGLLSFYVGGMAVPAHLLNAP